jgi:hypothetical protein
MQAGSTQCYAIKVPTTNGVKDTFNMSGQYFDCEHGVVYVMADSIETAANEVPTAIAIERVGFGLKLDPRS